MAKVEFNYKGNITTILCSEDETMEEICKKFGAKVGLDINKIDFLYSENKINFQLKFSEVINDKDKERKLISILVNDYNLEKVNNDSNIVKSKFPICPECKEKAIFKIDDYNYKIITSCKNKHSIKMTINEYINSQKIDLPKNVDNEKKIDINNSYHDEIYTCSTCKMQLCQSCIHHHDKNHDLDLINYDSKNYICETHDEIYDAFCKKCKINLCMLCQKKHKKHEIKYFGEILHDKNELLNKLKDLRNMIDIFNQDMDELINKVNKLKENLEVLYNIYYEMINNYQNKYRNYEIIMSLNSIDENIIIKNLKKINENTNIKDKIETILDIYERINFYEMKIEYNTYNIKNGEKIKIFGKEFVNNNLDKYKILYENKDFELNEEFVVNFYKNKLY